MDVSILYLLVSFVFSLMLAIKPTKNLGILNLIVGFFTFVIGLYCCVSFTLDYEFMFGLMVIFTGIFCMVRSDGISRLP